MRKYVCDKCGKIIEKPGYNCGVETRFHFVHFSFFNKRGTEDETYEEYDLCAECAETLWNWLNNTPKEECK